MLLVALRSLAVLIGILAYLSCFMYPDAEGRWQSRIEKLWIAIDDREKGSRTAALFNTVAALVTRGFNRVFGQRLFSFQFIGVSSSYSFAGMFFAWALFFLHISFGAVSSGAAPLSEKELKGVGAGLLIGFGCLVIGLVCFLLAVMSSLLPSFLSVSLSLIPVLLVAAWVARGIQLHLLFGNTPALALFGAFLASLLSDVLLLLLVRFTVRLILAKTNVYWVAIAVLIQLGVVVLLVVAPVEAVLSLAARFGNQPTALTIFGIFMGGLNVFTGIVSCTFTLVLLFLLLHRAFWPVLGRLFYPLARYQVIRNHKVMASIGTACFLFAFPLMWSPVRGILQWLAR